MPDVVVAAAFSIMEDPWHVLACQQAGEQLQSVSLKGNARAFPFFVCFNRIKPWIMST
jgi:hypothetical protein